jgi:HlyD family secretion protein
MHESKPNRASNLFILVVFLIVTVLGAIGLHYLLRDRVSVRVAHATYQDLISTISTNGKVEPLKDFQAHTLASGAVQQVLVREGQHVHTGDLMVSMSADDARNRLATAEEQLKAAELALQSEETGGTQEERLTLNSDLASAQLQAHQAAATLAATEKLQKNGAASMAEVTAARQKLLAAQNSLSLLQQRKASRYSPLDLAHAQSILDQAKASYAAAEANLSTIEVRAPFNGTVYSVAVKPYEFVNGGDNLVSVADLSQMRVRAYFDEPEIGKLAVGQPVRIVWDAKPNLTWHGHIVQVPDTVITYGTRTVGEVMIDVEDPDSNMLPNTNVTVTVTTLSRQHVLAVPREALHTEGVANYVYVVNDHTLAKRAIQIGGVNLTQVEVTGGLNNGDAVALSISGTQILSDNMHVDSLQ